ncbi:TrmH family RNA methyltransferase [Pareuzebyella sediminis]|uniref:TrmH family RNA methyltransferase n=1 Tax=Pareuzebyella sediminis TaxID=2607998 RepID=UPI0011EC65BF|nr:RNA methyltransferase [Pareuzebyella sediminis]
MVVKSQIKLIKSLQQKKYRIRHGLFVAEGIKTVKELVESDFDLYCIYATDSELEIEIGVEIQLIAEADLKKMSGLSTPNKVLAVFRIPMPKKVDFSQWIVALDDIRDPGNLGTIIRLCDWFDVPHLVCSNTTVDCYNPKTLQATMGSVSRVNIVYVDLEQFLQEANSPIYGGFMAGESVYEVKLPLAGILLLGNEANGISNAIANWVSHKVSIPQFGQSTTESLNVATASAILLNEIKRGEKG